MTQCAKTMYWTTLKSLIKSISHKHMGTGMEGGPGIAPIPIFRELKLNKEFWEEPIICFPLIHIQTD
jgi:hypothetical protein